MFTTYRLTEHHTAGGMSRILPYLSELQPEFFCEVSPRARRRARAGAPGLGHDRHRAHGDRGPGAGHRADAPAAVGGRHDRTRSACRTTGARTACRTGDAANELLSIALDPNVHIQETKAATCDIRPGRRPAGPALLAYVDELPAPRRHRPSRPAPRPTGGDRRWATDCPDRRDPAADAGYADPPAAHGLLHRHQRLHRLQGLRGGVQGVERASPRTASTLTGMSYDNTAGLGADTWRHVAFIEQRKPLGQAAIARARRRRRAGARRRPAPAPGAAAPRGSRVDLGMPATTLPGATPTGSGRRSAG